MEFKANCGIWGTMFGVPYIVADNFLKLATGDQLKVLIYCLRCSGRSCSAEEISKNTGVKVSDVADCIMFWEQANVLTANNPVISDSPAVQSIIAPPQVQSPAVQAESAPALHRESKQNFTPSEISEMMKKSTDISELFKIAESALGNLTHTQQNSLIWMYNYLGLKKEVIITLLFYCVKVEKASTAYIEKIACDWAENEINTLSAAQNEVQILTQSREFTGQIMKAFQMNRRPTTKQAEYINQWKIAGFGIELIHYAYEITIEKIDKLSFDYINKILVSWKTNGYSTISDVKAAEASYKEKKRAGKPAAADPDIEKYNVVINKLDLA